jgi:broad specificity phosphatase PhoE
MDASASIVSRGDFWRLNTVREITLIRHGRPTVSLGEWIEGEQLRNFVLRYDQAGLCETSHPSAQAKHRVQTAQVILTSDFRRTIESAERLGAKDLFQVDPLFREVDCWWNVASSLQLPSLCWIAYVRLCWPYRHHGAPEPPKVAQGRAADAAQRLITQTDRGNVVLVGHGGMNTLIAQALRRLGWSGPKQPSLAHWGYTVYRQSSHCRCKSESV